jgi:hypothetical protein
VLPLFMPLPLPLRLRELLFVEPFVPPDELPFFIDAAVAVRMPSNGRGRTTGPHRRSFPVLPSAHGATQRTLLIGHALLLRRQPLPVEPLDPRAPVVPKSNRPSSPMSELPSSRLRASASPPTPQSANGKQRTM